MDTNPEWSDRSKDEQRAIRTIVFDYMVCMQLENALKEPFEETIIDEQP